MPDIVYFAFTSLDGFVTDGDGNIDFHAPDEHVHAWANQLEARVSHHILDDRNYHIMSFWDDPDPAELSAPEMREYAALWQSKRKTVVSSTLTDADPQQYTIVQELTGTYLEDLKSRETGEIVIGGAALAKQAMELGMLDRVLLGIVPVLLGDGEPLFIEPRRTELTLVDCRTFPTGWVFVDYRCS